MFLCDRTTHSRALPASERTRTSAHTQVVETHDIWRPIKATYLVLEVIFIPVCLCVFVRGDARVWSLIHKHVPGPVWCEPSVKRLQFIFPRLSIVPPLEIHNKWWVLVNTPGVLSRISNIIFNDDHTVVTSSKKETDEMEKKAFRCLLIWQLGWNKRREKYKVIYRLSVKGLNTNFRCD